MRAAYALNFCTYVVTHKPNSSNDWSTIETYPFIDKVSLSVGEFEVSMQ